MATITSLMVIVRLTSRIDQFWNTEYNQNEERWQHNQTEIAQSAVGAEEYENIVEP